MKEPKYKLFESVVAARDLFAPELSEFWGRGKPAVIDGRKGVAKGTKGAIVELLPGGDVAVEFFDDEGETIDVAFIPSSYVQRRTAGGKPPGRAGRGVSSRA